MVVDLILIYLKDYKNSDENYIPKINERVCNAY